LCIAMRVASSVALKFTEQRKVVASILDGCQISYFLVSWGIF